MTRGLRGPHSVGLAGGCAHVFFCTSQRSFEAVVISFHFASASTTASASVVAFQATSTSSMPSRNVPASILLVCVYTKYHLRFIFASFSRFNLSKHRA